MDRTDKARGAGVRRNYFFMAGLLLLALSVIGFSDNLFTDVGQPSNRDPKFVVHGLFCLAWMVLFVVQAGLVRGGNLRLHRRLGIAGMMIAVGVVLSTLVVFVALWKGWDAMSFIARSNRLLLASYAVCVLLAWAYRARPDRHKRLLYVATLYMLEPALSRASSRLLDPLTAPLSDATADPIYLVFIFGGWNAFFLSLFVYDGIVLRRPHPVSVFAFAWLYVVWAIAALT